MDRITEIEALEIIGVNDLVFLKDVATDSQDEGITQEDGLLKLTGDKARNLRDLSTAGDRPKFFEHRPKPNFDEEVGVSMHDFFSSVKHGLADEHFKPSNHADVEEFEQRNLPTNPIRDSHHEVDHRVSTVAKKKVVRSEVKEINGDRWAHGYAADGELIAARILLPELPKVKR